MSRLRIDPEIFHPIVGTAVIVVIALFMGFGYAAKNSSGSGTYTVNARFRAVDGIGAGTTVTLAGIPIGSVSGMEIEPENHAAKITMAIDNGYEIPIDSIAMIVSDGIVGGKFVKIAPGGEYDMLAEGDEFEYVQDSVIIENLLAKVIAAAEARRKPETAN